MSQSRRVIITGTDRSGKSVVAEEVHAPLSGPGNFDFWQTKRANRQTTIRSAAHR